MPDGILKSPEFRSYLIIITVVVLSSLLALMPFLLNLQDVFSIHFWQTGMQAVYRFWDGPLYVVVSHTLYSPESPLYAASGLEEIFRGSSNFCHTSPALTSCPSQAVKIML